jgi:hypothetical protein
MSQTRLAVVGWATAYPRARISCIAQRFPSGSLKEANLEPSASGRAHRLDVAHLDPAAGELRASGVDVRDDQLEPPQRTRLHVGESRAEHDRAVRPGGCELLGFKVRDTHEIDGRLDWASLVSARARLMLSRASAPIDPRQQALLFYLYTEDLDRLREHLLGHGLAVGPIVDGSPGPEREIRLSDPDGYCLMIAESNGETSERSSSTQVSRADSAVDD